MKPETTKKVFLSHTHRDQELADAVAMVLSERGISVWDDKLSTVQEDRTTSTANALEQADSMIALLTPHAMSSSSVRTELEHAFFDDRYKHRLLPVLIGRQKDEFVRLPWILNRLESVRVTDREPTRARAKRIVDAFESLLAGSTEEK